ncbi:GGDEF domain-containing phosphodiesterase [Craterilacuibacter sp. RT1T]|uniref:putative bifunctional diguanylate cyclase/phosphodiesterase n=1 Tax=Craterilacuibacter sp. RT1T TaxID=2942211 RepID=UPI0020C07448|nr:GGDEF domain-containing phosphodiesterase [Craterilacuibacter sp. RT1T]MCL6263005.1 EAL domain-containing protein [Craterilacuibacter sp. RT1T]
MKYRALSLRLLLPLAVIIAFMLSVMLSLGWMRQIETQSIHEQADALLRSESARLSRLAATLQQHNPAQLEAEVMLTGAKSDSMETALVNADGQVRYASRSERKGQAAALALPAWDGAGFALARSGVKARLSHDAHNKKLSIMMPYTMAASPHEISALERGVVWIRYDYSQNMTAGLSHGLWQRLPEWLGMLLFAGILSWWVRGNVAIPLADLLGRSRALQQGRLDLPPVAEQGVAEIRELVQVFNAGLERTRQDRDSLLANQASLQLAQQVFDAATEGILVTDVNSRIIAVNPAFTDITGYSATDALGNTPTLLASGRHDTEFFRQFHRTLKQTGLWQGEIWNKRKNGEIYPQWLMVRAIRNEEDGSINRYVALFSDLACIYRAQEDARRLALYDSLTQLPNRKLLLEKLDETLSRQGGVAVLVLNINRFNKINEARGMQAGDQLLCSVGERLAAQFPHALLAHLTGDEFAILQTNLPASRREAASVMMHLANDVQASVALPIELQGSPVQLSVSIGIALASGDEDASELMLMAQTALSRARRQSGGYIAFFESSMGDIARKRFDIERDLRLAIAEGELRLYLQHQVNTQGQVCALEALVRWAHPVRGLVPPGEFITVAEESGLIIELDNWVLTAACQALAQLAAAGSPISIAVNVSPKHFAQDNFVDTVLATLEREGASPNRLLLEITEGLLLDKFDEARAKMAALSEAGIRFSIDDFGTGYSSLAYLKQLPIHELKIDQSFVRNLPGDKNDGALVDTIISIARHLGLAIVAEGVETQAQQHFLAARGELTLQGYLFARPMPAQTVIDTLIHSPEQHA